MNGKRVSIVGGLLTLLSIPSVAAFAMPQVVVDFAKWIFGPNSLQEAWSGKAVIAIAIFCVFLIATQAIFPKAGASRVMIALMFAIISAVGMPDAWVRLIITEWGAVFAILCALGPVVGILYLNWMMKQQFGESRAAHIITGFMCLVAIMLLGMVSDGLKGGSFSIFGSRGMTLSFGMIITIAQIALVLIAMKALMSAIWGDNNAQTYGTSAEKDALKKGGFDFGRFKDAIGSFGSAVKGTVKGGFGKVAKAGSGLFQNVKSMMLHNDAAASEVRELADEAIAYTEKERELLTKEGTSEDKIKRIDDWFMNLPPEELVGEKGAQNGAKYCSLLADALAEVANQEKLSGDLLNNMLPHVEKAIAVLKDASQKVGTVRNSAAKTAVAYSHARGSAFNRVKAALVAHMGKMGAVQVKIAGAKITRQDTTLLEAQFSQLQKEKEMLQKGISSLSSVHSEKIKPFEDVISQALGVMKRDVERLSEFEKGALDQEEKKLDPFKKRFQQQLGRLLTAQASLQRWKSRSAGSPFADQGLVPMSLDVASFLESYESLLSLSQQFYEENLLHLLDDGMEINQLLQKIRPDIEYLSEAISRLTQAYVAFDQACVQLLQTMGEVDSVQLARDLEEYVRAEKQEETLAEGTQHMDQAALESEEEGVVKDMLSAREKINAHVASITEAVARADQLRQITLGSLEKATSKIIQFRTQGIQKARDSLDTAGEQVQLGLAAAGAVR
jgi:hypothetical protein